MSLAQRVAALLGISAYQPPPVSGVPSLDSKSVENAREVMGGQLAPLTITPTRWYLSDLESAEVQADGGEICQAALLMKAANRDGVLLGAMSTRTGGLVRLPKRWRGSAQMIRALEQGHELGCSVFEEMCPASELALLVRDGVQLGIAVGELVPVKGRDYPVLTRLDPAFLTYRWNENRWYYRSIVGLIPITPGDGRWVLHCPGGRLSPWSNGLWKALGKLFIRKEHANLHKDNWEAKLANPARVAVMPAATTDAASDSWLRQIMAWGVNSVFATPPGYDVKIVESNGRGWDCFLKTIADCNAEMIICVAGQTVTTDGGTGFANADIHKSIRADLIKADAEALSYTLNTQIIPPFVAARWGEDQLAKRPVVTYDVEPARDRVQEATSLSTTATAITALTDALAKHGKQLDVGSICARFGIPVLGDLDRDGEDEASTEIKTPGGTSVRLRVVDDATSDYDDEDEDDEEAA